MSEETATVETPVVNDGQSQVDTPQNPAKDTQAESDEAKNNPYHKELKAKNAENKSLRDRLKVLEDAEKQKADAELSESQRLQKQLDEEMEGKNKLTTTAKNLLLRQAVNEIGAKLGARSPKTLAKLIDSDKLEFDLDGLDVKGVEDEIKRIKQEDPELFVTGGTDGGKGGTSRAGDALNMNDLIRVAARK